MEFFLNTNEVFNNEKKNSVHTHFLYTTIRITIQTSHSAALKIKVT